MSFIGLDPDRAGELARHLDEAAADLYARADRVAVLLAQAGISSSQAPTELRDVAAWAAYRARDLRKRIDRIVAADHVGAGPRVPGFRFATPQDAKSAADDAASKLRARIAKGDAKAARAELDSIAPYLADQRFATELLKRLGPKEAFDLLTIAKGTPAILAFGRALASAYRSGVVTDKFLYGILGAAQKRAAALDAYVHPWGGVDERDRAAVALDEYMHRAGSPPGTYKLAEATAPLVPYLAAGTRVAIIGAAVVIVAGVGACVVLSEGTCLGPAAATAEQGAVVFSGDDSALPTGLFETLPVDFDEADFSSFIDRIHTALPQFLGGGIRGSSATGVSFKTGQPFGDASDIDLAIVDEGLWAKVEELDIERWGAGTRTAPLEDSDVDKLGLRELQAELSEIAGRKVSIMIYRSMSDLLARGPAIILPPA